jgi:hypothetical protein
LKLERLRNALRAQAALSQTPPDKQ